MHNPKNLEFIRYSRDSFFEAVGSASTQASYLESYLSDLQSGVILREPNYFDRDYLAEFAAFYSVSSRGYDNICQRLHFFAGNIGRRTLTAAAGGGPQGRRALRKLQETYLGFIVKRPIPAAPLGRTVLKWFPDPNLKSTPRVVNPSRRYVVHIAGVELWVYGLAWQQQDSGVGACATISLWSMLHSSAFDDHHAIPTTADITQHAHKRHSFGIRVFPSKGLNIHQIYEAIREQDLVPLITDGDIKNDDRKTIGFSKARFACTCAWFIRSGYPVLIVGEYKSPAGTGQHAVCGVGFRSASPIPGDPDVPDLADSNIRILYVHDDNLGPSVRFAIDTDTRMAMTNEPSPIIEAIEVARLRPEPPSLLDGKLRQHSPTDQYGEIIPTQLIVAAHNDIRTDPDTLHKAALRHATNIADMLNKIAGSNDLENVTLSVSARFIRIADYLGSELERRLAGSRQQLARVRLGLTENVKPMSLHIGVVRIGLQDATPFVDILYDTTDTDRNHPIFAHVAFSEIASTIIRVLNAAGKADYGPCVPAY